MSRKLILLLLIFYSFFVVFKSISNIFSVKRERIAIVFYGKAPTILSLGLTDGVNYIITPNSDINIYVPGGPGQYRVGALGRLSELTHDPQLLSRAFSTLTASYIDYYFLPKKNVVYDWEAGGGAGIPRLSLLKTILAGDYQTNATTLERIYLFTRLFNKRKTDFILIKPRIDDSHSQPSYSPAATQKKFAGFFYEKYLRDESKNVKIAYRKYPSAVNLSRVIEGEGIRVVDLAPTGKIETDCVVSESQRNHSWSIKYLAAIFGCLVKSEAVAGADILFIPGASLEKNWQ